VRNLIVLLFLGTLAWYGYGKFKERSPGPEAQVADLARRAQPAADAPAPARAPEAQRFTCDGRIHCSQMRSCTEATYFIRHCPGTKMDGDNDEVPCEQQWCN
jgi:hypothetical protein